MITLASDFGSPYPAAMKGVLLSRADDPRLVDVAHDLPRGDPRSAAFWLRFVLPEFPPAVHLAVVDPGVGTDRAAVAVRAGDHALVGPDNGSLVPPARALAEASADAGADPEIEVFAVRTDDPRSSTFHGRDVFAPAAAAVHEAGVERMDALDSLDPVDEYESVLFSDARVETGRAVGEVLVVDDFGNAVTNVPGSFLDGHRGGSVTVRTSGGEASVPVVETFADAPAGDPLVTVGSHGYVECDVNRGRGDEAFDLAPGRSVVLSFDEEETQLLPT
ncbi:SAM hydrolase/SAM-dependent halogenase family protein [Candidatus Halobonum tyrrellensis]|uniref:NAD operon protein n=1 Tax=Candidatus Halobonum tyrrellensis G22 TaxID=1324957 RepID=V4HE26_9EURY|nr:SAM-dependent chlorinase/fluorinase [Candidatus Halobonum tyrrellensis]ESP88293.1 NAD operon protein [Candidatus Halobonum tyrrellensis G22]